jgi:hypothetical protein
MKLIEIEKGKMPKVDLSVDRQTEIIDRKNGIQITVIATLIDWRGQDAIRLDISVNCRSIFWTDHLLPKDADFIGNCFLKNWYKLNYGGGE